MLKMPPLVSAYSNKQPLFKGIGPSKMEDCWCASAGDVVDPGDGGGLADEVKSEDRFERSPVAGRSLAIAKENAGASGWELFPLLPQYKGMDYGLAPEDREPYKVVIQDGTLFRTDGSLFPQRGGQFRYVVDANGQLFMEDVNNKAGIATHASFIGDNPVRGAGRIMMKMGEDGKAMITSIDNESGHYHPSREALVRIVDWLQAQGITVAKKAYVEAGKFVFF